MYLDELHDCGDTFLRLAAAKLLFELVIDEYRVDRARHLVLLHDAEADWQILSDEYLPFLQLGCLLVLHEEVGHLVLLHDVEHQDVEKTEYQVE